MSTFVGIDVECPVCGTVTRREVATSINASRSPEWRDVILGGDFQRFTCPTCGDRAAPILPFPYIDFDRKQYIGVFPASDEAAWWVHEREPSEAFERNLGRFAPAVAQPIGADMHVRTVFGLDALREKILVLDAGLDDAVLEALKLRLLVAREDLSSALEDRPRLIAATDEALDFVVLAPSEESGRDLYRLSVPRADYDLVAQDRALRPLVEALSAGPYRDAGRLLEPAPA